jgi:hypothetical protein
MDGNGRSGAQQPGGEVEDLVGGAFDQHGPLPFDGEIDRRRGHLDRKVGAAASSSRLVMIAWRSPKVMTIVAGTTDTVRPGAVKCDFRESLRLPAVGGLPFERNRAGVRMARSERAPGAPLVVSGRLQVVEGAVAAVIARGNGPGKRSA